MGLIEQYANLKYGFLGSQQYAYTMAMSVNPALFRLFELRHFLFFTVGMVLSLFNIRAILPFLLIILLDLDYSKLDGKTKRWLWFFFCASSLILIVFGGVSSA